MKKKGNFLNSLIYKFAKSENDKFYLKNKPMYNIRNSSFIKRFTNRTFSIHNGKEFIKNDTEYMYELYKRQSFKSFKLGQFSYNRRPICRGRPSEVWLIFKDLKRKKGINVKTEKKKKSIFTIFRNRK